MKLRWAAVGLLAAAECINFTDRSAVFIVLPGIYADLHLSAAQAGLLSSASTWNPCGG